VRAITAADNVPQAVTQLRECMQSHQQSRAV